MRRQQKAKVCRFVIDTISRGLKIDVTNHVDHPQAIIRIRTPTPRYADIAHLQGRFLNCDKHVEVQLRRMWLYSEATPKPHTTATPSRRQHYANELHAAPMRIVSTYIARISHQPRISIWGGS